MALDTAQHLVVSNPRPRRPCWPRSRSPRRSNVVIAEVAVDNGPDLLAAVAAERPDAAIVGVPLPPTFTDEGLRAALEARRLFPGLPIRVLWPCVEQLYAREPLAAGQGGTAYLIKDRVMDGGQFIDAVRRIATGGTGLDLHPAGPAAFRRRQPTPPRGAGVPQPMNARRRSSMEESEPTTQRGPFACAMRERTVRHGALGAGSSTQPRGADQAKQHHAATSSTPRQGFDPTPKAGVAGSNPAGGTRQKAPDRSWSGAFDIHF
jgi:hypothetical protein